MRALKLIGTETAFNIKCDTEKNIYINKSCMIVMWYSERLLRFFLHESFSIFRYVHFAFWQTLFGVHHVVVFVLSVKYLCFFLFSFPVISLFPFCNVSEQTNNSSQSNVHNNFEIIEKGIKTTNWARSKHCGKWKIWWKSQKSIVKK